MINLWPFGGGSKASLGVDIGTSALRVVELAQHGQQEKLENYAKVLFPSSRTGPPASSTGRGFSLGTKRIAELLREVLAEARIKTTRASFSLPDFSTLFTTFTIPSMKPEEVPRAVQFEARQRVPLPISEITLDWLVIGGDYAPRSESPLEILLVVVPNRVVDRYVRIAELANLKLIGVEAEVFALQRVFLRDKEGTFGLIDIGLQSTTISIVDEGLLKVSHSFDLGGGNLTYSLIKGLNLSQTEAEVFKQNRGLAGRGKTPEAINPFLDQMVREIKSITDDFYNNRGRDVSKYFLVGGTAGTPGLAQYFQDKMEKEVEVGFPFEGMVYPPILENELIKIAPEFAIATGMALKGIEE